MPDLAYLFIDGGYLRKRHAEAMQRVFGAMGELDFEIIQRWFQNRYALRRIFYYDCLHDIKETAAETDQQLALRVQKQQQLFATIRSLRGVHVRLGRLVGNPGNVRQKGVDVLLSVEMLDNAFRKNMEAALLLAGDADFVPLVEAVTRLGTWVEVVHAPRTASKELCAAADVALPLSIDDLWSWSVAGFRQPRTLPLYRGGVIQTVDQLGPVNRREGTNQSGLRVTRGEEINPHGFFLYVHEPNNVHIFTHEEPVVLENYYAEKFGAIAWQ
jgi:uncharacterized LabA/DUF88 family protein